MNEMSKELGYIDKVFFGLNDSGKCFNLKLELRYGKTDSGVGYLSTYNKSIQFYDPDHPSDGNEFLIYLHDLMKDAKVSELKNLVGVPVEVFVADGVLVNFRILKEVIR